MTGPTPHDHAERVQGCFRCDLSHDETARAQVEELAASMGMSVDEVERSAAALVEALTGDAR